MKKVFLAICFALGFFLIYEIFIIAVNFSFELYFMQDINQRVQEMAESGIPINSSYIDKLLEDEMLKVVNIKSIIISALTLLTVFIIFKVKKLRFTQETSIKPIKLISLPISVVCVVALVCFTNLTMQLLYLNVPQVNRLFNEFSQHLIYQNTNLQFNFASMVIVAPIFEEILYRGLLLSRFRKGIPIAVAIILQGILFAYSHGNIVHILTTVGFGVVAGVLVNKHKSILGVVLMHFTNNLLVFLDINIVNIIPKDTYFVALIGFIIVFVVSLVALLKIAPSRCEKFSDINRLKLSKT